MAHQPINKKNNCHIGRGNRFCYKASTGDHFQKDTRVTHTHIFQCIVTVNMHIVTFPRATHSTPQGNLTFCIYIKKTVQLFSGVLTGSYSATSHKRKLSFTFYRRFISLPSFPCITQVRRRHKHISFIFSHGRPLLLIGIYLSVSCLPKGHQSS